VLLPSSLVRIVRLTRPFFRPQYWEIYKLGEVRGISLPFITIDLLGGILNDLSLVFKPKFDVLAGVCYSVVVVMDAVVIVAALVLNPRAKRRREAEKAAAATTAQGQGQRRDDMREPEGIREQESQRTSSTVASLPQTEEKERSEKV
jgi:hypothetical protein